MASMFLLVSLQKIQEKGDRAFATGFVSYIIEACDHHLQPSDKQVLAFPKLVLHDSGIPRALQRSYLRQRDQPKHGQMVNKT